MFIEYYLILKFFGYLYHYITILMILRLIYKKLYIFSNNQSSKSYSLYIIYIKIFIYL